MESDTDSFNMYSLREILTIVFKHKRKIAVVFLVMSVISLAMLLWKPKETYNARARLMIKFGREFVAKSELGSERQSMFNPQNAILTEIELIRSPDVVSRVVTTMGPERLYPELSHNSSPEGIPSAAIERFREDLKVEVVPNTSMLDITFVHPNPDVAGKVVNLLIELMKEKHLQTFSGNSTAFLEQQFNNYSSQLKQSESRWETFKQKNSVFSIDEQRTAILTQKSAFESTLRTTQTQIAELEHRLMLMKGGKSNIELAQDARSRLMLLHEKEQALLMKYNESSRAVQNVREEIQTMQKTLLESSESTKRDSITKLESELSTLRARADANMRQISQLNGQLHSLDLKVKDSQEIRREIASQEANYKTYLQKLEEARISDDMDRQKMVALKVIDEANISNAKIGKNRLKMAGAGFLGALLGGLMLAFILEFISPVMTVPLDAERRLGVPVMVAIMKK